MRALVIITNGSKSLWKKNTSTWSTEEVANNEDEIDAFDLRSEKVGEGKKVLLFCHYSTWEGSERESQKEIKRVTAKRVLKVMSLYPSTEMSIAAHSDTVDWSQVEQQVDAAEFSHEEFDHASGDEIYDKIVKLTETPTEESFEAIEAEVKKK